MVNLGQAPLLDLTPDQLRAASRQHDERQIGPRQLRCKALDPIRSSGWENPVRPENTNKQVSSNFAKTVSAAHRQAPSSAACGSQPIAYRRASRRAV